MKVEERNKEKREGGTTVNKERRNKGHYDFFSIAHKGWKEIRKEGREGRQKGLGSKEGQVILLLFCRVHQERKKGNRKEGRKKEVKVGKG